LSYRGLPGPRGSRRRSETTLAYRHTGTQLEAPSSAHALGLVRQDRTSVVGRNALIGYVAVLGVGYVLGSKAGRRRYEQIAGTCRTLTSSPAAKSLIEGGRRKIANRISPDAGFVTVAEIDNETAVVEREALTRSDRRR